MAETWGIERILLYLPATGLDLEALAAAGGARGRGVERRVAGADEDVVTLTYEVLAAAEAWREAPVTLAAGPLPGYGDDLRVALEGADWQGPATLAAGSVRGTWELVALTRGRRWLQSLASVAHARLDEPAAATWSDGAAALGWGDQPRLELLEVAHETWYHRDHWLGAEGAVHLDTAGFGTAGGLMRAARWAQERVQGDAARLWAVSTPVPGAKRRLGKLLGDRLVTSADHGHGYLGTADPAFVLAAAASQLAAGEELALLVVGYGATLLRFRAVGPLDDLVAAPRWREPVRRLAPVRWERLRRPGDRFVAGPSASPALIAADERWELRRYGGRCAACGQLTYPLAPRCIVCGADALTPERVRGVGTAFTYTIDHLNPSLDPPTTMIVAELDEGGRLYLQATDDLHDGVEPGRRVEVTLRLIHLGSDGRTPHYFWKFRSHPES